MTDLREKQPEKQVLDYKYKTYGAYTYEIEVIAMPYSSIKNEDVYARKTIFKLRAGCFSDAAGISEVLAATIKACHDVWETSIHRIERV